MVGLKPPWWHRDTAERYWLEFTDRLDLGANLRAPQLDEAGRENWRYSLFKLAKIGDLVFHYHKPHDALVAVSRVAGEWQPRPIVWGARGTFARAKGVQPHERPGYVVPLADYTRLAVPLRLEDLRKQKPVLRKMMETLRLRHPGHAIYFPFELAERPVRPLQGYAFKLPKEFVRLFQLNELAAVLQDDSLRNSIDTVRQPGQGFVANTEVRLVLERHAMAIALRHFRSRGFRVRNVSRTHPYDVLAENGHKILTIEVKGTAGRGHSVFLTRNEVEHARRDSSSAVLFVVHGIQVAQNGGRLTACGGQVHVELPWVIDEGLLEALQYRYTMPSHLT